jgi:3-hydroxybutyryl-CoA dehydrogenase
MASDPLRVGVLGAGVMGSGIAQVTATAGCPTVCYDVDADALAAATDRPGSVIGWHWASPAPVMRFAEIVRTRDTAEDTVTTVCDVARRCGKSPVVVRDVDTAWGFVANRVYGAMLVEARRVVDEGVATAEDVDQLMRDCFGWPTGPFGMIQGASGGWG